MKKSFLVGVLLFGSTCIYSQINMADSTVGVVGFWNLNEKQSYSLTKEKYKITGSDTSSFERFIYQVDITILDSTLNSYIIEWHYRDFVSLSNDPVVQKLSKVSENLSVIIKTDELGGIIEVVNWEEIRGSIYKATALIREDLKDIPNIDELIQKVENNYLTKENVESGAIRDILQYYYFHGGLYQLNDVLEAEIQLPNLYGGKPFDADVSIWLDEINDKDFNSVLRMTQSVDSEQLTNATYLYLKELSSIADSTLPDRIDFAPLHNETWIVSQIHESGWILFSMETKETLMGNVIDVENMIIEIQ